VSQALRDNAIAVGVGISWLRLLSQRQVASGTKLRAESAIYCAFGTDRRLGQQQRLPTSRRYQCPIGTRESNAMARRVFFSFHYDDIWRVNQVRNSWVVTGDRETTGFIDKAEFEKVERQGRRAIEAWIDLQLGGTSTTIVLIGAETANRPYVQYEILESYKRGNGLLGVRIHNIKDASGQTGWLGGPDPFANVHVEGGMFGRIPLGDKLSIPIYDWVNDNGRNSIASWIERAPRKTA
jgi:hypothetical protein